MRKTKVSCEFDLCIYNEKDKCILGEIEISTAGCCDSCIIPDFPEDWLQIFKKKTLNAYDIIHKGWDKKDSEIK